MYAIIEAGGKQYKVSSGDTLRIEGLSSGNGESMSIDKVLAVVDGAKTVFGTPYIKGAEVKAEVVGGGKARKVIVYKQRPRKGYRKLRGHRQPFTTVKIKEVSFGG
ncbi:MAG: 50S ribosomal protein L21 [Thermodesulfovibrionales bacterium]